MLKRESKLHVSYIERRLNDEVVVTYKLQSVLGSMVKPKTMPQKPDKVEMAVAFEL